MHNLNKFFQFFIKKLFCLLGITICVAIYRYGKSIVGHFFIFNLANFPLQVAIRPVLVNSFLSTTKAPKPRIIVAPIAKRPFASSFTPFLSNLYGERILFINHNKSPSPKIKKHLLLVNSVQGNPLILGFLNSLGVLHKKDMIPVMLLKITAISQKVNFFLRKKSFLQQKGRAVRFRADFLRT